MFVKDGWPLRDCYVGDVLAVEYLRLTGATQQPLAPSFQAIDSFKYISVDDPQSSKVEIRYNLHDAVRSILQPNGPEWLDLFAVNASRATAILEWSEVRSGRADFCKFVVNSSLPVYNWRREFLAVCLSWLNTSS